LAGKSIYFGKKNNGRYRPLYALYGYVSGFLQP